MECNISLEEIIQPETFGIPKGMGNAISISIVFVINPSDTKGFGNHIGYTRGGGSGRLPRYLMTTLT